MVWYSPTRHSIGHFGDGSTLTSSRNWF